MSKKGINNLTPRSQLEATRRREEKNRLHARKKSYQRTARLFVRTYADKDDMDELNKIFLNENPNGIEDEDQEAYQAGLDGEEKYYKPILEKHKDKINKK